MRPLAELANFAGRVATRRLGSVSLQTNYVSNFWLPSRFQRRPSHKTGHVGAKQYLLPDHDHEYQGRGRPGAAGTEVGGYGTTLAPSGNPPTA